MITEGKMKLYDDVNCLLTHLDYKKGYIVKLLDDNFGVLKFGFKFVLFDTCDFWVSTDTTASQAEKALPSLLKEGDVVMFHAVLVNFSSVVPYLANRISVKR